MAIGCSKELGIAILYYDGVFIIADIIHYFSLLIKNDDLSTIVFLANTIYPHQL